MNCKCFDKRVEFKPTDSFEIRLDKSKCYCSSRFKVKERKSSFCIDCKECKLVDKYKIDGHFDNSKSHKKCDYLFLYHKKNAKIIIFVELKGGDLKEAVHQIDTTISIFEKEQFFKKIKEFELIGAIVSSSYPSDDASFRKLKTKIIRKYKRYNLQIEHKVFFMRYDPERKIFLGRNEK